MAADSSPSVEIGPPGSDVLELVHRLESVDVCAVSDALDALGLEGVVSGLAPMWEGARLVGRVITVGLAEAPAPPGLPPVHLGVRAIVAADPGDVIVVGNAGRTGMGAWGGLLSTAAGLRGVAGVVADGACRDVDEARALGFAVFARAPIARTARGRVYERSVGEPIQVGYCVVSTGDIVVADGSGVAFLRAHSAAAVVDKAQELSRRETQMRDRLESGEPADRVLGASYERMLDPAPDGPGPPASAFTPAVENVSASADRD